MDTMDTPTSPPSELAPRAGQSTPASSFSSSSSLNHSSATSLPPAPHVMYVPQFASTTDLILSRFRLDGASGDGSNSLSPGGAAPVDRTMTMPMPLPSPAAKPPTEPDARSSAAATCTVCTVCKQSSLSLFNPLVACRRCGARWHRLCHEPAIADYVAAAAVDGDPAWSCASCAASNAERAAKRVKVAAASAPDTLSLPLVSDTTGDNTGSRVSWAHRPASQRRAYLAQLPRRELAQLLLRSTELHPDLPIFPPDGSAPEPEMPPAANAQPPVAPPPQQPQAGLPSASTKASSAVAAAPLPPPAPKYRNGIINSIRKSAYTSPAGRPAAATSAPPVANGRPPPPPTPGAGKPRSIVIIKRRDGAPTFAATPVDPEEEDPTGLMAGWPRPGRGLYARLGPDWENEALVDAKDHGSFSSVIYDGVGRKLRENGLPVLVR